MRDKNESVNSTKNANCARHNAQGAQSGRRQKSARLKQLRDAYVFPKIYIYLDIKLAACNLIRAPLTIHSTRFVYLYFRTVKTLCLSSFSVLMPMPMPLSMPMCRLFSKCKTLSICSGKRQSVEAWLRL